MPRGSVHDTFADDGHRNQAKYSKAKDRTLDARPSTLRRRTYFLSRQPKTSKEQSHYNVNFSLKPGTVIFCRIARAEKRRAISRHISNRRSCCYAQSQDLIHLSNGRPTTWVYVSNDGSSKISNSRLLHPPLNCKIHREYQTQQRQDKISVFSVTNSLMPPDESMVQTFTQTAARRPSSDRLPSRLRRTRTTRATAPSSRPSSGDVGIARQLVSLRQREWAA